MLDSVLSFAVMIFLGMDLLLKEKTKKYIQSKDMENFVKMYWSVRLQLFLQLSVLIMSVIRSCLPESTAFSCFLILIIVLLTSYDWYHTYKMHTIITDFIQKHQK